HAAGRSPARTRRAEAGTTAADGGPGGAAAGADAVFASRVLHHAPLPSRALAAIVGLARPAATEGRGDPTTGGVGGAVVVLDYESHHDESLREQEADRWLGFAPAELAEMARAAGLVGVHVRRLPAAWCGDGPDRHLRWQLLVGRRGAVAAERVTTAPRSARTD
ncbi:MAG: hypothetical protein HY908_33245, partial [Myxococcales bacterium]|nr:hypothetical protein [Myxococcales bacterium]